MNGGERVATVLRAHGVPLLFTLCGGHISPILAAARARGIRIVDTRHEATAVFAADAVARLTGRPVKLMYRRDWSPTPAAKAYHDLIFREWWTNVSGTAGEDGTFSTSVFYGIYRITINGVSKEISFSKKSDKTVVVDLKL